MTKLNKIGYSLRDVAVVQSPISYQKHRGDVNPFVNICMRDSYPIFVAPMASVTDEKNYKKWIKNKLTPVVPRSVQNNCTIEERLAIAKETFVSFSLSEINEIFNKDLLCNSDFKNPFYICIDIAHGTLSSLYEICFKIKEKYGEGVILMTGNIATPQAYENYCNHGIDYVRCSIGSGSRCTSSVNVSVHYPLATLLDEINDIRNSLPETLPDNPIYRKTKVIADGGIGWFDDIQKSIALGADAVMIGKLFAECEEACGDIIWALSERDVERGNYLTKKEKERLIKNYDNYGEFYLKNEYLNPDDLKPFRMYFGMSTREAQKLTGGDGKKTSEGISRPVSVKYPVGKLISNMDSYLRSCMTYTNSSNIEDLRTNTEMIILGGCGDKVYRK